MTRFLLPAAVVLPLVALAAPAYASVPASDKWTSAPTLNVQRDSSLPTAWYDDVLAAIDAVNLGAYSTYIVVQDDDDSDVNTVAQNLENELIFTSSKTLLCGDGSDGCAWWWSSGTTRLESDVYLDSTVSWDTDRVTTDTLSYGGAERPLATTTTHELGHFLGLGHESRYYNVMGVDYEYMGANGTEYFPTMGEDATTGLGTLYGYASGYEDLAVTHWKWQGCRTAYLTFRGTVIAYCSGYSEHTRGRLLDSSGIELPVSWSAGEPTYTASKGSWLQEQGVDVPLRVATDFADGHGHRLLHGHDQAGRP